MAFNNNVLPQAQPTKVALTTNYISAYDYTSVYKPDYLPMIASKYGNQRLQFVLEGLSTDWYFSGDTYKWAEEGRLRAKHTGITRSGENFTTPTAHTFKVNDDVILISATAYVQAIVTSTPNSTTFVAKPKTVAGYTGFATSAITAIHEGTEFGKSSDIVDGSLQSQQLILENTPKIHRTSVSISASDFGQKTWLEAENGGFYWTQREMEDGKFRHLDEINIMQLMAKNVEVGSSASSAGKKGTEGVLDSIYKRGLVWDGYITTLADFDTIIKRLRQEGAINEYLIMCNITQSLLLDDMLGAINAYDQSKSNYGNFANKANMFLDLGFQGFQRGNVKFMKSVYPLLDDPQSLGSLDETVVGKPLSIFIPIGSKQTFVSGASQTVPYLSIGYHKTSEEDRKLKTIITGSVGLSVPTDHVDAVTVSYTSDFMTRVVGANNFIACVKG